MSIAPVTQTGHRARLSSTVTRSIAGGLAALAIALVAAGPVLAHAELVDSDPADGATLATPPTTITLTFSQALDRSKSSFRLSGPDGNVGTGAATAPRKMTLDGLALAPGDYLIKWVSASADDGDIARGQLTFTVTAPPSPTPTPTPNDTPTAEPPSGAPSTAPTVAAPTPSPVTPTPVPSAAPTSPAASTGDVVLPIIVGLLLVAAVGAFVLRRSRGA